MAAIVRKAMEPDPDKRWQTAAEMLRAFEHLHENDPRTRRRKRCMAATAGLLALCFLAGGGMTFVGLKQMERTQNALALASFSADRLAELRAASPDTDFYAALTADGGEDSRAFLAELDELRFGAGELSSHELLWQLYDRTNLLGVFGAMERGEERQSNLLTLAELARRFEGAGHKGLFCGRTGPSWPCPPPAGRGAACAS